MIQRLFRKWILPLAALCATGAVALAQWQPTGALNAGALQGKQITAFAASGANIFVASLGGVFFTSDNGADWLPADSGITNLNVTSLAAVGTTIYAGTIGGGVFSSANGGASWKLIGLNGIEVRSLAAMNGALYAGTHKDGVYSSFDNGATWARFNTDTAFHPSYVYSLLVSDTTIYAGTSSGIYSATENNPYWVETDSGIIGKTVYTIYSLFKSGNTLYAGSANGAYTSTNNGKSWQMLGLLAGSVSAFAAHGNDLYAAVGINTGFTGVFHSTNGGTTWIAVDSGLFDTDVRALLASGNTLFAGTFTGGVFRSTNGGAIWNRSGVSLAFAASLVTCHANIIAGTDDGIIVSTDNGASWSQQTISNDVGIFFTVKGNLAYAGQSNGAIYLSTDSGKDWTLVNSGVGNRLSSLAIMDTLLFAGALGAGDLAPHGGVLVSNDGGIQWKLAPSSPDSVIYSLLVNNSFLYAGAKNGFFISSNNGTSWNRINTGLPDRPIIALTSGNGNIFAGTDSGGVFYSTDNGTTWLDANNGLTNKNIVTLAANDSIVLAGTSGGGVFLTRSNSIKWAAANKGLHDSTIYSLALSDSNAYAALGLDGVWRRPLVNLLTTAVRERTNLLPIGFALTQNYPNPFSIASDIAFSVADPTLYGKELSVSLYDADGRTLETLYRGNADAQEHTIHLQGAALPAGDYFYSIECGGETVRKELTVVR